MHIDVTLILCIIVINCFNTCELNLVYQTSISFWARESIVSIALITCRSVHSWAWRPTVIVSTFVDVLVYCKDVSEASTVHWALKLEFVNEICVVSASNISHEPLNLRYQSNVTSFETHANGTRSCWSTWITHQVIVKGLGIVLIGSKVDSWVQIIWGFSNLEVSVWVCSWNLRELALADCSSRVLVRKWAFIVANSNVVICWITF